MLVAGLTGPAQTQQVLAAEEDSLAADVRGVIRPYCDGDLLQRRRGAELAAAQGHGVFPTAYSPSS